MAYFYFKADCGIKVEILYKEFKLSELVDIGIFL